MTLVDNPLVFGLGPMPGTDLVKAADVVLSELPLPHIPQLPARGIGFDAIGRTAALLDIPVDPGPRGWRVAARKRGLTDNMARDLDVLEELWAGKVDRVKVQLVGPWTLAAAIEMPNGHRMITDAGAFRDVRDALQGAVGEHRGDVDKRLAPTVLQLDEPLLTDIMRGTLPGAAEYERIAAVPEPEEAYAPYGEFLLNAPLLIDAAWQTTTLNAEKDALAGLLDRGARLAIPVTPPREVLQLFDELQIDPATAAIDIVAEAGDSMLTTADNFREARKMASALR